MALTSSDIVLHPRFDPGESKRAQGHLRRDPDGGRHADELVYDLFNEYSGPTTLGRPIQGPWTGLGTPGRPSTAT